MKNLLIVFFFTLFIYTQICLAQWQMQNSGIKGTIIAVGFSNPNQGFAISNDTRLSTTDGGSFWQSQSYTFDSHLYDVFFINENNGWILRTYSNQSVFNWTVDFTTNGGISWQSGHMQQTGNWPLYSMYFNNKNNGWTVGTVGLVYRTTNGGIDWTNQVSNTGSYLNSVFFADSLNGWAVGDHTNSLGSSIIKTINGGLNWLQQTEVTLHNLRSVYFTDINNGWIVGDYGMVLKTDDGGTNWEFQDCGIDTNYSNNLNKIYFIDDKNGWIVGNNGLILHTNNGGQSWNKQESGTTSNLYSLFFIDNDNGWVVGSDGVILHTTNGGISSVDEKTDRLPKEFDLLQNYPNPFNPTTTIKYTIPQENFVTIKVYDALGQNVTTLVNKEKSPGNYIVEFNGSKYPTGIYFYSINVGNYSSVKKMILLK